MQFFFGEAFVAGGLAGLPFCGVSGITAYAHHAVDHGNLFILFAPHCGVTKEGVVGKCRRPGQHADSACCGAAVGAKEFADQATEAPTVDPGLDFQMDVIKSGVYKEKARINASAQPMVELTQVLFEMNRDMLTQIIRACSIKMPITKFIVVGGIQINSTPCEFFQPQYAWQYDGAEDKVGKDITAEVVG